MKYRYAWFALTVKEWERVPGMREYDSVAEALGKLGIVKEKYRVAFDEEPKSDSIRIDAVRLEPEWVYSAAE